ncbi:AAA domain-containing protein [Mycena alexandri]|uniref:AAA domain-containing protein n=1 Tax=Mycena alexandri TaxID=1745969 RepID=A0AAD6WMN7_9AGAR|nr:AAA domain-containing protein [Mycena alexandri]
MTTTSPVPPLLGDERGVYRVHIVGNCGSGKSTVATQLAVFLGVPYICLDALFWKPGWEKETNSQFRVNVEKALEAAPNGWVVDGNYGRRIGTIVEESATDVIWLDPPLVLYFPRIVLRTFRRLLGREAPCSPGCPERFQEVFFSRESMILWCLTHHGLVRRREGARMAQIGFGIGVNVEGQKMRRFGGWGEALRSWLRDVQAMVQSR